MTDFVKKLEHIGQLLRNEQDPLKRNEQRKVLLQTIAKLELMNRGNRA